MVVLLEHMYGSQGNDKCATSSRRCTLIPVRPVIRAGIWPKHNNNFQMKIPVPFLILVTQFVVAHGY